MMTLADKFLENNTGLKNAQLLDKYTVLKILIMYIKITRPYEKEIFFNDF